QLKSHRQAQLDRTGQRRGVRGFAKFGRASGSSNGRKFMKPRHFVRAISSVAALLVTTSFAGAQVSDDVVKIGVLTDMTGLYSDLSGPGSVAAAQMSVEDFGGKVLGKRIEVISADHQNKPDVGAAIARRWFDLEEVDAIVDVPTSSVAFAVQE